MLSNELKGEEADLGSIKIQNVTEAIYLGQLISYEEKTKKEVNRRVSIAWAKFWGLKHIFKGSYSNKLKSDIFNSCIIPSLTYASQTWAITKKDVERLRITQIKMERSILELRLRDRIPLTHIKAKLKGNKYVIETIRRQKWAWAGHVARFKDNRWSYLMTFWTPQHKRRRGRQKIRWRDDFDDFLRNNLYHRVAMDRREWERLREAFAQRQDLWG